MKNRIPWKHESHTKPSFLMERINGILMKRYAVEKLVGIKKLIGVLFLAALAFVIFQLFWIIIASKPVGLYNNEIILEIVVLLILGIFWKNAWKSIGHFVPKFVWIGLLGWLLIGASIVPNFIHESELDSSGSVKTLNKDKTHSISLPITRYFNLNEKEIDTENEYHQKFSLHYIDTFIAPFTMPLQNEKFFPCQQMVESLSWRLCRYVLILLSFVFFFDIFFTTKAGCAVAAVACDDFNFRFVDEFHLMPVRPEQPVRACRRRK